MRSDDIVMVSGRYSLLGFTTEISTMEMKWELELTTTVHDIHTCTCTSGFQINLGKRNNALYMSIASTVQITRKVTNTRVARALLTCDEAFTRECNPTRVIMASTRERYGEYTRVLVLECNSYVSRLLASGERISVRRRQQERRQRVQAVGAIGKSGKAGEIDGSRREDDIAIALANRDSLRAYTRFSC